jgi:HD-like signal output (HDOD) protein
MAIIPQMSSSPDQLPPRRVELILQQLEELPTLPAVAARVIEAVADQESNVRDIVASSAAIRP